jgi:hypothetical protein
MEGEIARIEETVIITITFSDNISIGEVSLNFCNRHLRFSEQIYDSIFLP